MAWGADTRTSFHSGNTGHQTATEFIQLQTPEQTTRIGFTDQKVSGRAGPLTFARFLHWQRFRELLAKVLPHLRKVEWRWVLHHARS
jgi:hypothetical protein